MKYLLLGGAGVFAVHTAKFLLENDKTSLVLSVGRNKPKSPAFTLDVGLDDDRYKFEQAHIVYEKDILKELIDKYEPNYIINFAALAYATSWYKSFRYYDTNVTAVADLCEYLYDNKSLKKFLQIGTSELYGSNNVAVKETHSLNPTSPYAVSKLAADMHLETLFKTKKFPMNIIRPSNCYGSGQYMYRIIPKAIFCGLKNIKFPLQGGGTAKKSFMHSRDLAEAIYQILHNTEPGETYNAGTLEPVSMKHIVSKIAENIGMKFDDLVEITTGRQHEDSVYWLDSSKLFKDTGWQAKITLEDGIKETREWVEKHLDELSNSDFEFTLRA